MRRKSANISGKATVGSLCWRLILKIIKSSLTADMTLMEWPKPRLHQLCYWTVAAKTQFCNEMLQQTQLTFLQSLSCCCKTPVTLSLFHITHCN